MNARAPVWLLLIDDARLDPRDSVSAFVSEESAKAAAQAYHDEHRVSQALDRFGLDWREDAQGKAAADDVALSIDFFVMLLEVGS